MDTKPERHVFRHVVEQCLRHFSGFLMEATVVHDLQQPFGDNVVRGDEGSKIDAGMITQDQQESEVITGHEIKSLTLSERNTSEIGKTQGPRMIGDINYENTQLQSDFWHICFPLLRDPFYRATLPPKTAGLVPKRGQRKRVCFRYATLGQRIDHVVPASLWPYVKLIEDATPQILAAQEQNNTNTRADIADSGRITRDHLQNKSRQNETQYIAYLKTKLNIDGTSYRIADTVYHPYTGDLLIESLESKLSVFVELKIGYCQILDAPAQQNDAVLLTQHEAAHPNHGAPIFTYTGGRWTYILTTFGTQKIQFEGSELPRYALLIHRDDIPRDWWYSSPLVPGYLSGTISRGGLVDLSQDVSKQIENILNADRLRGRFDLPFLEDFASLTYKQLSKGLEEAADGAVTMVHRENKPSGRRLVRISYRHQAETALQFLHSCHNMRKGLVFDWQINELNLRSYAFTRYDWSPGDVDHTSVRPNRPPREIYQTATKFILLAFCEGRHCPNKDKVFIHPTILRGLKDMQQNGDFGRGRCMLVISSKRPLNGLGQSSGLYAIPDDAIRCESPISSNHSEWKFLDMRDGEDIESYYHQNMDDLVVSLTNFLQESPDVTVARNAYPLWRFHLQITTQQDVMEAITSRNESGTRAGDDEEDSGKKGRDDKDSTKEHVESDMSLF